MGRLVGEVCKEYMSEALLFSGVIIPGGYAVVGMCDSTCYAVYDVVYVV